MTELTFLIDLLLNHKLAKPTREAIATRLKDVEIALSTTQMRVPPQAQQINPPLNTVDLRGIQIPPHMVGQSASTIAAMMRHAQTPTVNIAPQELSQMPTVGIAPQPEPAPVAVIAQTPMAAAALNARQEAILQGISGKPEKGRTSPRKF